MTVTETRDEYAHARANASAWFNDLLASYRDYADGDERIEERMRESALDVSVRSDWHAPGELGDLGEYKILLTTGGPALRVYGGLDQYGEPMDAQLQMQDWGTPWREVWPCEVDGMEEARNALMWFAGLFYYGE